MAIAARGAAKTSFGAPATGSGEVQKVRIVDVACGLYHSATLDSEGRLWTFGFNSSGQLGLGRAAGDGPAFALPPRVARGGGLGGGLDPVAAALKKSKDESKARAAAAAGIDHEDFQDRLMPTLVTLHQVEAL